MSNPLVEKSHDLKLLTVEIIKGIGELEELKDDLVHKLKELKEKIEKHRRDVNISKTVGNSTSIVAGAVGVGLAFFTFGASLIVAAGVAAAGAAVSIGADIGNSIVSKSFLTEMTTILDQFRQKADSLNQVCEELNKKLYANFPDDPEEEGAAKQILGYVGATTAFGKEALQVLEAIGHLKNVQRGFFLVHGFEKGGEILLASGEAALQGASAFAKLSKFSKVAKFGGPVLFAVTAIVDIADIALSWSTKDPQISAIDDAIEKMGTATEELVEYKQELVKLHL